MKILLLIGDITIGGGAERVVINLANALLNSNIMLKFLVFISKGKILLMS